MQILEPQICVILNINKNQLQMKNIAIYFLKLAFFYLLVVLVVEVAFDNLQAYGINPSTYNWKEVTVSAISSSFDHACRLEWKELKVVQLSVWLFHNKIHYILMVLVALVLYYQYRDSNLKQPTISRIQKKDADTYEEEKKKYTQEQVSKLVNSQEYKKYQWQKHEEEKEEHSKPRIEEEETNSDWDRAEEQLFDR